MVDFWIRTALASVNGCFQAYITWKKKKNWHTLFTVSAQGTSWKYNLIQKQASPINIGKSLFWWIIPRQQQAFTNNE